MKIIEVIINIHGYDFYLISIQLTRNRLLDHHNHVSFGFLVVVQSDSLVTGSCTSLSSVSQPIEILISHAIVSMKGFVYGGLDVSITSLFFSFFIFLTKL